MWASSPMVSRLSPPPPCLLPKITIPSTPNKPVVQRCFFTLAVSNKAQRRPPPNADENPKNIGGLGLSVLTAVKSNQNNTASNPKQQQQQQGGKSIGKKERELSGADVLLALQRGNALKIKTQKRRQNPSSSSTKTNRGLRSTDEEEGNVNYYGEVRPICVKSKWITRLDELEKRLQELVDEVQ